MIAPSGGVGASGYTDLYSDPGNDAADTVHGIGCGVARGSLALRWRGSRPRLGAAGVLELSRIATRSAAAVVFVGGSDRSWNGLSLLRSLSSVGFAGCVLSAGPDLVVPGGGTAQLAITIPASTLWGGASVVCQGAAVDASAPGGWAFSDAVRLVLGQF